MHERRGDHEDQLAVRRPRPCSACSCSCCTRSRVNGSMPPARAEEEVLAAPHHALGHARGAAGVDDDLVVAGALGEVPLGRAVGVAPCERLGVEAVLAGAGAVLDHHERLEQREALLHRGDAGPELLVVEERLEVGVAEEVLELLLDVAVVDVHRHGPHLEDRQERLDPLRGCCSRRCRCGRRARCPGRAGGGRGGSPARRARGTSRVVSPQIRAVSIRNGIDGVFEQVPPVVRHGASRTRCRTGLQAPCRIF